MSQVRSPIRTIAIVASLLVALFAGASAAIPTATASVAASPIPVGSIPAPAANLPAKAETTASSERLAIIGGSDTDIAQHGYMATVQLPNSFCGGTLIAPDWVLTAEHCVPADRSPDDLQVRLGATDLSSDDGVTYRAKKIEAHDRADIALIQLDDSVRDLRPVTLATTEMAPNWAADGSGIALGWGLTSAEGSVNGTLQSAELTLVLDRVCSYWEDDPGVVCAGGDGTGACRGDSGGPLLVDVDGVSTQVGVTSFGMFCGSPAGFVEIATYSDWITQTLGPIYGVSAQVATACEDRSAVTRVQIANETPYVKAATISLEGIEDRIVSIPAQGLVTEEISDRPTGNHTATVRVDGEVVSSMTEIVECAFNVQFEYRCVSGDGAFEARITNNDPETAEFEFRVGSISKSATVAPGKSESLMITGRPDGYHTLRVLRDGVVTDEETIATDCDPPEPEVSVKSSCLAGMGRVDVFLTNPTDETQDYSVAVGRLQPRLTTVKAETRERVTVTGRPDGKIPVFVERGDGNLTIRNVDVACSPFPDEPVTIKQSCLAGKGRIDVMLANTGSDTAEFGVTVGDLAERVRQIQAAMAKRVTVTGRPDGPITVVVTQDGTEIYTGDIEIGCDQ